MPFTGTVAQRITLHRAGPRCREPPAVELEHLSGRDEVGVTRVIVGEIVTREGAVSELGFVLNRDVRLDPVSTKYRCHSFCHLEMSLFGGRGWAAGGRGAPA